MHGTVTGTHLHPVSASRASPRVTSAYQQISITRLLLARAWQGILLAPGCTARRERVSIHPRSHSQFQTVATTKVLPSISRTILNAICLTFCQCTLHVTALFLHDSLPSRRNDSVRYSGGPPVVRLFLSLGPRLCLHCHFTQRKNIHTLHPRGKRHN